jgi:hypothetical protein
MNPIFKTTDGQEHDSEQAHDDHQEVLDAFEAHRDARRTYGALLARTLKTADGQPLKLDSCLTARYWWIPEIYPGRPWLAEVSLHHWEIELDEDGRPPAYLYFEDAGKGGGTWRTIRPEEIFSSKKAAEAEYVRRFARWTAENFRQMGPYVHADDFVEVARILDRIGGLDP